MTDLAALLERVEKAEGPDREIDAELYFWFGMSKRQRTDALKFRERNCEGRELYSIAILAGIVAMDYYSTCNPIEKYTASLDAAVALVEKMLPGSSWMAARPPEKTGRAVIVRELVSESEATAATPALALIAALLKELIAKSAQGAAK